MKWCSRQRSDITQLSVVGMATVALYASLMPLGLQEGALDVVVLMLGGLAVMLFLNHAKVSYGKRHLQGLQGMPLPLTLVPENELFEYYASLVASLERIARESDAQFRELAMLKLGSFDKQIKDISDGHFVFHETEAWRTVYDSLLNTSATKTYYSVSWVTNPGYWLDQLGRQSMQANFKLVRRGYWIERTIILAEELWPTYEHFPVDEVRPWIEEQHASGIFIRLVREVDLIGERDLPADFGIYGNRAVGEQVVGENSRTISFHLSFGRQGVREGLDRWQRLNLFAAEYRGLLNQASRRRSAMSVQHSERGRQGET